MTNPKCKALIIDSMLYTISKATRNGGKKNKSLPH